MNRALYIAPAVLFAVLAVFLFKGLYVPRQELPSMLVNAPAPKDDLPALSAATPGFAARDLAAGHVTVVNFFASWCIPCRQEATVLPRLAQIPGVMLYGIAYKDLPDKAAAFLAETGNPFTRLDLDEAGKAGIDWGVTGVPETFVIDGRGTVLLRHQGPLTQGVIDNEILPVIAQAQSR